MRTPQIQRAWPSIPDFRRDDLTAQCAFWPRPRRIDARLTKQKVEKELDQGGSKTQGFRGRKILRRSQVCVANITDSLDCGSAPPTPTCTDGIMNGDEEGIDCCGSCPLSCEAAALVAGPSLGHARIYPDPNSGEQLFINITAVEAEIMHVDIYELSGKLVCARHRGAGWLREPST